MEEQVIPMTHEEVDLLTTYPNAPTLETLPPLLDEFGVEIVETVEEKQLRFDTVFAAGLAEYKTLLHTQRTNYDNYQAQLIIQAGINAQEARINAHFLVDGGIPWRVGIFDDSNPLKQMRDMLGTPELTAKLDLLDAAKVAWEAEQAVKAQEDQILSVGKIVEARCTKALHYVAGMNVAAGKTVEQIDAMEVEFAPILSALKNHRPDKAASLIALVANPEYDVMKAKLLAILAGG